MSQPRGGGDRLELEDPSGEGTRGCLPGARTAIRRGTGAETGCLDRCFGELVRALRFATLGRRCQGVVHNLNTPLQVISFQLELLQQEAQKEEALLARWGDTARPLKDLAAQRQRRLKQLTREVESITALVERLLGHTLQEAAETRTFLDLNRLVEEELTLYQENLQFKHQVAKEFHLCGNLPPLWGHYFDLAQSFRYLVDNALEAMTLASRRWLRVVTEYAQGVRRLKVGDTGPGIPPALLPHLGTPFVTTKHGDKPPHPGLGLFLAQRLLAPYGGHLEVESRPGETWVSMVLPAEAQQIPPDPPEP